MRATIKVEPKYIMNESNQFYSQEIGRDTSVFLLEVELSWNRNLQVHFLRGIRELFRQVVFLCAGCVDAQSKNILSATFTLLSLSFGVFITTKAVIMHFSRFIV
jgi:hypothetical protein